MYHVKLFTSECKMNFSKGLYSIKSRYPSLSLLRISDNLFLSKSLSCTLINPHLSFSSFSKEISQNCRRFTDRHFICFYSSAANENQVKLKNPVISVPPLQFKDLTFESPVIHSNLCDALHICGSIEEQMLALTSMVGLSPDDVKNRIYFVKVIESHLKPFFGEMKIQIFGSTLNGFGFKGCDIDMSFDTFAEGQEKIPYLENDVPLVSEVIHGKVSPTDMALLPPKEQLIFIHSVLRENYRESEAAPQYIPAVIPLIRFYHDKFGLKCDLTCRNRVAFSNTKLLYLFGKLDDRVIPLMMTIRYWAKHVEIIGKNLMFNTYTISLLVIHFLQTRNPPILPSAEYILSLSDSLQIEDMDDKSFLEIKNHVPPTENTQTLSELLKDFFFYYLYFDFTRVICPLIGGSIPREEFQERFPSKKFHLNSICVQDPMLVTHNVAELVDFKHCRKFFTELMIGCKLFHNSSDLLPSTNKWGISILLDKPEDYQLNNWQISVPVIIPLVTKQVLSDSKENDIKLSTAETLLFLLRHILLFECTPLGIPDVIKRLKKHDKHIENLKKEIEMKMQYNSLLDEYNKKYKKKHKDTFSLQNIDNAFMLEDFQEFISKNKLLLCAECKVTRNSWTGRNNVSLESLPIDIANNLLNKEHFISVHAAKENEPNTSDKKENTKPFVFFFECYESPNLPESSLLLNFRPYQKTFFNPILGIFLKEYLPELIRNINDSC